MKDRDADRLLSGGRPSGPRLDRVWEGIERDVAPRRARSLLRIFFTAAVPLAAVIALIFLRTDPFVERGGGAPLLEATCGSADSPCRVGETIHLRLLPGSGEASIYLVAGGDRSLIGEFALDPDEHTPIPVKITPEESDVAGGIDLEIVTGSTKDVLHLTVVP